MKSLIKNGSDLKPKDLKPGQLYQVICWFNPRLIDDLSRQINPILMFVETKTIANGFEAIHHHYFLNAEAKMIRLYDIDIRDLELVKDV